MMEDKLTADQRIRLESLTQANIALNREAAMRGPRGPLDGGALEWLDPARQLTRAAADLETFIRDGGEVRSVRVVQA